MDETERLSQEDKCNKERVGGVLEQAELIARGVLESIQALAGTTTCKGVQIAQLTKWAKANGYWILSDTNDARLTICHTFLLILQRFTPKSQCDRR